MTTPEPHSRASTDAMSQIDMNQQTLVGYESPIPGMALAIQCEVTTKGNLPVGTTNSLKNVDLEADTGLEHDGEKLTKMTSKASVASLPAPDGGYGWFVVLAAFLVNFYAWGLSLSWGVYQDLYLRDIYKGQTTTLKIAFVGTSANAIIVSLGLFLTPVINRIGHQGTMAIGTVLAPLSLILASFSTELWQLYLTQGLLFGIGCAFVFSPSISLPAQWFDKHRGLATGMSVCGSGVGGLALTPLVEFLISNVGYRASLRYTGIGGILVLGVATALARPRWAVKKTGNFKIVDTSLLSKQLLVLVFYGTMVTFGYLVPYFLMPAYAISIGLSPATGAIIAGAMSGVNAVARIGLGYMADVSGRVNTMFVCTIIAALSCLLLWPFADSFGTLLAFGIVYGGSGGGFISLFPVVTADIVGVKNIGRALDITYLSNLLGNLLGTPVAGAILDATNGWYLPAMLFAGCMTLIAAGSMLYLKHLRGNGKFWKMV